MDVSRSTVLRESTWDLNTYFQLRISIYNTNHWLIFMQRIQKTHKIIIFSLLKTIVRCLTYILLSQSHLETHIYIVFLHENFYKLNAVKFSLVNSPAMKNKNIRFLCLSLRIEKINVLFIFTLTIPQINQNCVFSQTKIV